MFPVWEELGNIQTDTQTHSLTDWCFHREIKLNYIKEKLHLQNVDRPNDEDFTNKKKQVMFDFTDVDTVSDKNELDSQDSVYVYRYRQSFYISDEFLETM